MTRGPERLDLFGVIHVDQHRKVQRELAPLVADADAICLEAPERLSPATALRAAARAPLCTLGAFLLELFAYLPLYLLFNRDTRSTEAVAVSKLADDRPVYRVDRNPIELLAAAGPALVAANWLLLVGLAVSAPVQTALSVGTVLGCLLAPGVVRRTLHETLGVVLAVVGLVVAYWLLLVGPLALTPVGLAAMLALVVVVHGTVGRRNDAMIDNTIDHAAAGEHDRVVLVTGKAHLSGMVPLARERGVEVGRVHVSRWLRSGRTYDGAPDRSDHGVDPESVSGLQASPGARLRAGLIDAAVVLVLWAAVGAVALAVASLSPEATLTSLVAVPETVLTLLVALPLVWVGYRGLLEAGGGTLGQRVANLRVVDTSGEPVGRRRALARNAVLGLDLALLCLPALLSERGRLISDHLTAAHVIATAER
jgi:uncharacterized RDD family membrane protein YckC